MGLPRDPNTMLPAELGLLRPVRNEDVVPLVGEDVREVRWPGAGDPVRRAIRLGAAGAAAEGDDDIGPELRRQLDRPLEGGVIRLGESRHGVHRIAVHGESRDLEAVVLDHRLDPILLLLGTENPGGIEERGTGIGSDGDLDRIEPALSAVGQGLFEAASGEQGRHHSEFHDRILS